MLISFGPISVLYNNKVHYKMSYIKKFGDIGDSPPHHHHHRHHHYLIRNATLKQTNSTLQHTFSKMILNMQPYFILTGNTQRYKYKIQTRKIMKIKTDPHKIDDKNTNQSVLA